MKKTLSVLVMAAIMLSVFFCIPVNAATDLVVGISKGAGLTVNSVTASLVATQLCPDYSNLGIDWNSNDPTEYTVPNTYFGTVTVLVQLRISNNSNTCKQVTKLYPKFDFENSTSIEVRRVIDITNYSNSLLLNFSDSDAYIELSASPDYCDGSTVVVAPHGNVLALAKVKFLVEVTPPLQDADIYQSTYFAHLNACSFAGNTFTAVDTTVWPNGDHRDITQELAELVSIMNGNTTTNNNVSSDSGTLATQSNSVHSQEAAYYAQNSQAIQATGLSNYQFDSSAVSGLTGVRGDFLDVWNSLGGWNSVYIFSLTLGLALTILRHSPSAISSAIRRRRQNNE